MAGNDSGEKTKAEAIARISDGVIAVDDALQYTYLNERAAELLAVDAASLLGADFWDPFSETSKAVGQPHIEQARATGTDQTFQWETETATYMVRVYPDEQGLTVLLLELVDQQPDEQTLGRLHEATRKMLVAETAPEIADLISMAALRILDLPINAVYFYDDDTDALISAAQSDRSRERFGEATPLQSGFVWEAYQSGIVSLASDGKGGGALFDADTTLQSRLAVPLADHGVFVVASTARDAFTETDITLTQLLGANATVALDQLTSENRLAKQRDNLELLTRMMSHDIRNDLQVVGAVAEILGETLDGPEQEYIEKIRRNTAAAVDLTTSAQELTEAMLRSNAETSQMALQQTLEDQIETLTETNPEVRVTTVDPIPSVTVLADDMLGSVFRNVLNNAVRHNDADVPEVTVSVELTSQTATVRIADNGPGVPDDRKQDIFGRGERGMSSHGTGIGLYLVQTLTEQYGGHVWVEDNDPRGAVFGIELERADAE